MRKARARLPIDPPEINLVPLLDMVSLLIQLMLINARFGLFAEVGSFAAMPGSATDGTADLGLIVRVNERGYDVSWTDGGERVRKHLGCPTAPCAPDAYDRDALRALLVPLKRLDPDETRAVIVPGTNVPFEVIVGTMDVLRAEDRDEPMFPQILFPPDAGT